MIRRTVSVFVLAVVAIALGGGGLAPLKAHGADRLARANPGSAMLLAKRWLTPEEKANLLTNKMRRIIQAAKNTKQRYYQCRNNMNRYRGKLNAIRIRYQQGRGRPGDRQRYRRYADAYRHYRNCANKARSRYYQLRNYFYRVKKVRNEWRRAAQSGGGYVAAYGNSPPPPRRPLRTAPPPRPARPAPRQRDDGLGLLGVRAAPVIRTR